MIYILFTYLPSEPEIAMSVKHAILGLLQYGDMHGYRIKSHLETHFGYMWSINYGQIYPSLKQMEKEGLVTKTAVSQAGTPERKLYAITPAGREAFARWLEAPPERRIIFRDPFLLRFVFSGFGRKERVLELIDEQIQVYEKQLERRRENLHRWKRHGLHVRLVAELGALFNEAFLTWLHHARKEVARSSGRASQAQGAGSFLDPGGRP